MSLSLQYVFNPAKRPVLRVGFIKADKRTEPFRIEVDYLRFR